MKLESINFIISCKLVLFLLLILLLKTNFIDIYAQLKVEFTSCNKDLNEYKDIVELPPLLQNILSGINTLTNNYNNNFTSFNELKNKESPKIHIDFPVSGSSYITNQIDIKGSHC